MQPFQLAGIDGIQPAGTYEVETDEELIYGASRPVYRRVATTLQIRRGGVTQIHMIDPVDLDASLLRDAGLTILHNTKH